MNTYFVKVALRNVSPVIWRRLRVQCNTLLADLHHIIQIAMGWDNEHLHSFRIYGEDYGVSYEGGMSFNHNVRQVFLNDFGFEAGDRFTYTYNFIDHWLCDIRIEHIEHPATPTPWCYGGSGLQREDGTRYYKIDGKGLVGLSLSESKLVLKQLQKAIVHQQADHYTEAHRCCPSCHKKRRIKGSCDIQYRTLFGINTLSNQRLYHGQCEASTAKTFSVLNDWMPEHNSPELQYIETKWASLMSYGLTVDLLKRECAILILMQERNCLANWIARSGLYGTATLLKALIDWKTATGSVMMRRFTTASAVS